MSKTDTFRPVTIIVPVYGDLPSLTGCIESLSKYVDTSIHRVLLVNDCGPDADTIEASLKKQVKPLKNFFYSRNKKNLGFVQTCNRAVFDLDKTDNDILLLNSDTEVTEGFLDEMLQVLRSSNKIGAISPRSNNATIATIPISAIRDKGIDPAASFELFQKIKTKLPRYSETPVAHGFCMLIRRTLIKKYGLFDEIFGKGYGEEVDFCQRIKKQGYSSGLCNHAFVFHLEARSFTLEKKAELLSTNNEIIVARYPHYRESVRDYIQKATEREGMVDPTYRRGKDAIKSSLKMLIKKNKNIEKAARKIRSSLRQG